MPNISIYPIKSILSHNNTISSDSKKLLDNLSLLLGKDYHFNYIDNFNNINSDLVLILVQSGGSEALFKNDIYPYYKGPYYLLTYGSANSLAASLEILTFIKQNYKKGEVLHGDDNYIVNRIKELIKTDNNMEVSRLGVLGKPSDWLISSNVDYKRCKDIFNIDLIDIDQEEVIDSILSSKDEYDTSKYNYNKEEIRKALKINEGLKKIVEKYKLSGFTIRCFDIILKVKSSTCLSLALFNKDDIIGTCEGDIPALITAYLILKLLHVHCFQANPQWINPIKNEIELAHCTLPLDMSDKITYDSHFESGIGVGLHGELRKEEITIVKIDSSLTEFYCEEGCIIGNEYRKDRCRTQVKIKMNSDVRYFLTSSLGNHHQILYGHHKKEIKKYLESFGLRQITI